MTQPQSWQKVLIPKTATIQQAIERINQESLRIALVVDEERKLLGVVTDGDIRRALLKRVALDSVVSEIMVTDPQVGSLGDTRAKLLAQMNQLDLLHIPIVEGEILVGLETLQNLISVPSYDNPVFLMAGGFGKRLQPLTDDCPKPLLKVGDKPILETIVERLSAAGFHDFYISTHYKPEMIREHFGSGKKWGIKITYVHEEAPLGTGGALGLLPDTLPDLPLIMMNGDVLTRVDFEQLLKYHNERDPICTMCVREHEYQVPYGVIQSDGHIITEMVEKPIQKYFVNAGIYVVSRLLANSVAANQNIDMPHLLERAMKDNHMVSMFPLYEYWLDIGRKEDFEQAQVDIYEINI